MATVYLLSEFRDKDAVAEAIQSLRAAGVSTADLDVFSEEPVEFRRGVLDRPSRMSLISVLGAIVLGSTATAFVWWAQNNYAVITGGMPLFSFWGTGVITYEMTMLGAVLSTFAYFLWESGLLRKRDKTVPVPVVPPECICLRVRCDGGDFAEANGAAARSRSDFGRKEGSLMRRAIVAFALAAFALPLLAADQKPLPWEKNHLQIGQAIYRANCVVCHDVDKPQSESKKLGPSFYHLFRQDKLPLSGDKLTRAAIRDKIKSGSVIMPAFGDKLNDSEINLLLDYLQTK